MPDAIVLDPAVVPTPEPVPCSRSGADVVYSCPPSVLQFARATAAGGRGDPIWNAVCCQADAIAAASKAPGGAGVYRQGLHARCALAYAEHAMPQRRMQRCGAWSLRWRVRQVGPAGLFSLHN